MNEVSIPVLLVSIMLAFLWGAAFKSFLDGCYYRQGVRDGYRVGTGDIDSELDEARRVLSLPHTEDTYHEDNQ